MSVHLAHEEPQWSGSSFAQTEQVPWSQRDPPGQSPSFAHCAQAPALHLDVAPAQAAQLGPQCASSLSVQGSHAPPLHQLPAPQSASSPHAAQAP